MKKQAKDLVKGDRIKIVDQECIIESIEVSDIGKHGKRKVRIEAKTAKEEKIVIIRPDDYLFDSL